MSFYRRNARALRGAACVVFVATTLLLLNFGCTPSTAAEVRTKPDPLGCGTLPQARVNPLMQISDPLVVRPLTLDDLPGPREDYEPNTGRSAGVAVEVPAQQGWTRTWLERRLLCYQMTAGAQDVDAMLVSGARIDVIAKQGYFEVTITSEDPDLAEQITAAAARLPEPRQVATAR